MNRMIVTSRVGSDGILHVTVPVGTADADKEVRVTIEPAWTNGAVQDDYIEWLRAVAGRWQGEFYRPPQDALEERESLT
jgi:hypothetical protein